MSFLELKKLEEKLYFEKLGKSDSREGVFTYLYYFFKSNNVPLNISILAIEIIFQYLQYTNIYNIEDGKKIALAALELAYINNDEYGNFLNPPNLSEYRMNIVKVLSLKSIYFTFPTIYDFIILYTNDDKILREKSLGYLEILLKTPEVLNQIPSLLAFKLVLNSSDNSAFVFDKLKKITGYTEQDLKTISYINKKDILMSPKLNRNNDISIQTISSINNNYFDKDAIYTTIVPSKSINVIKYSKEINYYDIMSLIESFDTKEQILKIDNFLSNQSFLGILKYQKVIEWIKKIVKRFNYSDEILFLSIQIFNQYVNKVDIKKEELELTITASFFLACKNENGEITNKQRKDFTSFGLRNIVKMEDKIIIGLEYDINIPTIHNFLSLYINDEDIKNKAIKIAKLILEYQPFVNELPSKIASSIIYFLVEEWDNYMIELTKYNLGDLEDCINAIKKIV